MRISDWSSDVCSSDLLEQALALNEGERAAGSSETDRPESPVIDLCYLSWTSFALGEPEQALAQCRRSLDVAAARGASYDLVVANGNACYLHRSEEHTSELQSLMRISYAVFCLQKKKANRKKTIVHVITKRK